MTYVLTSGPEHENKKRGPSTTTVESFSKLYYLEKWHLKLTKQDNETGIQNLF